MSSGTAALSSSDAWLNRYESCNSSARAIAKPR